MKNENINVLRESVADSPSRYEIKDVETFNKMIDRPLHYYFYNGSRTDNGCEDGYLWFIPI